MDRFATKDSQPSTSSRKREYDEDLNDDIPLPVKLAKGNFKSAFGEELAGDDSGFGCCDDDLLVDMESNVIQQSFVAAVHGQLIA